MTERSRGRLSLFWVVAFYGAMAGAAALASHLMFDDWPLVIRQTDVPLWAGVLAGAVLGLALVASSRFSTARYEWAKRLDRNFEHILGRVGPAEAAVMALSSGIAEEMLFRGFALRALLPRTGDPGLGAMVLALLVSSLAFGLLHIGPDRSYLPWTAFAVLAGALFGALALWTGDITGAVVAHLTVNYFNFLAIGRDA